MSLIGIFHLRRDQVESLLDELRQLRSQLLQRIELLEDDVEVLLQQSMESSKDFYYFERDVSARIDRLEAQVVQLQDEGQEGSKVDY